MFKRVIWMGTGMAVGAGGAFWAKRKAEATIERYLPEQVAERAATSARDLGRTVRDAATEGREAMRQRELELRAAVESRTFVGPVPQEPRSAPVRRHQPAPRRR
jgi:hypothetical protein